MARLSMRSMTKGAFDLQRMRSEYIDFMTTPGSHNDAYASTYHRMFFANRARGMPLEQCPDNDAHNVDAIDGLIVPVPVILATLNESEAVASQQAQMSVRVTRQSDKVEQFVPALVAILRAVLAGHAAADVAREASLELYHVAQDPTSRDPVVACYIDPSFHSLLHFLTKYTDFRSGVLANANSGGENVHRGLVLGAILGAQAGASGLPEDLKAGLKNANVLAKEIQAFVAARVKSDDAAGENERDVASEL